MLKRIIFFINIYFLIFLNPSHAITIEMKKGDIIKGEFGLERLRIQLKIGGVIEIPVKQLVDLSDDLNVFKLRDGTVFHGTILDEKLIIKTKFGELKIPVQEIKKIKFESIKELEKVSEAKAFSLEDVEVKCWGADLTDGRIGGWKSKYPHCILDDGGGDSNAIYDGKIFLKENQICISMENLHTKAPPMHTLEIGFHIILRKGSFSDGGKEKIVKMKRFRGVPDSQRVEKCFELLLK